MKTFTTIAIFLICVFFFSCKDNPLGSPSGNSIQAEQDNLFKKSVSDSFLTLLQESCSESKNVKGNELLPLKDGKPDASKIMIVYHYTYNWDLIDKNTTINLDEVKLVFNPNAISLFFFESDKKEEMVGYAFGSRLKEDDSYWIITIGAQEYLHLDIEGYSYHVNRVKGDKLIGINVAVPTYYAAEKDKGMYFDDLIKPYDRDDPFLKTMPYYKEHPEIIKVGKQQTEYELRKYGKKEILEILYDMKEARKIWKKNEESMLGR